MLVAFFTFVLFVIVQLIALWIGHGVGRKAAAAAVDNVLREYLADYDSDIEGCDGDQLQKIECEIAAATELRHRLRLHLLYGMDGRGVFRKNYP